LGVLWAWFVGLVECEVERFCPFLSIFDGLGLSFLLSGFVVSFVLVGGGISLVYNDFAIINKRTKK